MNKHYVLTPIGEVVGLPDGNYLILDNDDLPDGYSFYFNGKDWVDREGEPMQRVDHSFRYKQRFTNYLRPITDGIVISGEEFRKELNSAWSQGAYLNSPTDYINLIISKYKDNGK